MAKKLKLIGLKNPTDNGGATFVAMINPEQISHSGSIQMAESQGTNTAGNTNQFKSYAPETVSFDLYFDATGVVDDINLPVDVQIAALKAVVYDYQGDIHKPHYVKISWAPFKDFVCHLTTFKTDYTLFKADGTPLRAKVNLSFKQYIDPKTREAWANKSSPDLTHAKTIRMGDALPLMCKDIYGKVDFYPQVASSNGLTNFRELAVGDVLDFPPLER